MTLTIGTPTSISATSTNSVTSTSHTHAIDDSALVSTGMAGLAVGTIGTYASFICNDVATVSAGTTVLGSTLTYASTSSGVGLNSGTPAGTWRCMGYRGTNTSVVTTYLRIS
jgi:hypothetical protein